MIQIVIGKKTPRQFTAVLFKALFDQVCKFKNMKKKSGFVELNTIA